MKTITLENGVKLIVADDYIANILNEHFNKIPTPSKVSDTTASDINKTNYSNAPNLISDANHLSD